MSLRCTPYTRYGPTYPIQVQCWAIFLWPVSRECYRRSLALSSLLLRATLAQLGGPSALRISFGTQNLVYRDPHLTLKLCEVRGLETSLNNYVSAILGYGCHYIPSVIMTSKCDQPVLYYSWFILYNDGPALKQHWMCVFYLCCCRLTFV